MFRYCLVIETQGTILIGSNEPIQWDPDAVLKRAESDFSSRYFAQGEKPLEDLWEVFRQEPIVIPADFDRSTIVDFNTDLFQRMSTLSRKSKRLRYNNEAPRFSKAQKVLVHSRASR